MNLSTRLVLGGYRDVAIGLKARDTYQPRQSYGTYTEVVSIVRSSLKHKANKLPARKPEVIRS